MRLHRMYAGLLALGALSVAPAARADITFGGNARAFAMGGAGIAIVDRSEHNTLINPAALALYNRRVHVGFPTIGFSASGVSLSAAYNHLFTQSRNGAVTLAKDFGGQPSDFGAALGEDIRFGHLEANAFGIGKVHVIPNQALETWSKTANGDVTKLTGNERADIIGAGLYALPAIGVAERISPPGSPIHVEGGFRVKLERAVYTHYIVDANSLRNNSGAMTAPEITHGTTITEDGVGVDFGLLAHPKEHAGFSGALVVTNLITPNFIIHGTDANGNPIKYDLQPGSVSVGSAYEQGKMIFALDAVDLTRAYGNPQARYGMQYRTKRLALRAGYASARGFTVGFGYGWFDFAYGARAPLEVTETLRF